MDFIFKIENDEDFWELSLTQTPYSRYVIKQYLENAHKDIYEVKQLRLMISSYKDEPLGLIDFFDFDFKNKRAGIGIIIKKSEDRGKGYGAEALELLVNYGFSRLNLHQVYCNIAENNKASIKLFKSQNFEEVGLKKDWNFSNKSFKNEYLFQRINK